MKSKNKKAIGIMFAVIIAVSVFTSIAIPLSATEQNKVGIGSVLEKNQVEHDIEKLPLDEYILSTISEEPEFVPGEVIIKFKPGVSLNISMPTDEIATMGIKSIDALNKRYSVTSQEKVFKTTKKPVVKEIPDLTNIYKLELPKDADILSIVEEYQKDPNIEYAEPNYIRYTCVMPNDPYYSQQWAHQNMQSEQAWDIEKGDSNVVIAIVDTGIDWNHPDLAANIWSNSGEIAGNGIDDDGNGYIDDIRGWDFVNTTNPNCVDIDCTDRDNDPMDNQGHGTHCAGIAGAVTDNGVGVAGMAWDCKIMAVRAGYKTPSGGSLDDDDSAAAIVYAADNGADVISMSFGGSSFSNLKRDAINYAYGQGVVLVGAAGNENSGSIHYPSGFDNVIAVSATDSSDTKVWFSNYGSWVDVAAPGLDINSTFFDDTYKTISGTSMSAPYVAGLVGLILSNNPSFTQEEVKSILHSTTDPVSSSEYIGIGRINAYKAIQVDSIPIANLNSSLDDANVYGTVDITGTASGDNFQNYTVEYGVGNYPTSWTEITSSTTPVTNGILATWSAIPGTFSIRLRVTDTAGQTSEDRVNMDTRTKLYLCGPNRYLSEDPNTVLYYTATIPSGSASWDDYFLTGDINGTHYSYCLYLASVSSTTFKIKIIIDGTTVASDTVTASSTSYRKFCNELIGLDPITSDGDEVILKITKISGGTGSVRYGAGVDSHIKVPPTVVLEPDIWVRQMSFNKTLPQDIVQNYTLSIGNNGTGALNFDILIDYAEEQTSSAKTTTFNAIEDTNSDSINEIEDGTGIAFVNCDKNCKLMSLLSNNSGDSLSQIIVVNNTNYTLRSSEDKAGTVGNTKLYLRNTRCNCKGSRVLKTSKGSCTSGCITIGHKTTVTWDNYILKGDISGDEYDFSLWASTDSHTKFTAKIKVDGKTLATYNFDCYTKYPKFKRFTKKVTGIDPDTVSGDKVKLEITYSGDYGAISYNQYDVYSYITIGPVEKHDMAVTNVYTTPSSPTVGQATTIYVTVKNEGNQAESNVPVKAYVNGSQVDSTKFVSLSAGQSTTKSFSWTPSTAKTYSVKGEVGVVSGETDTADNTKIIEVYVSPKDWLSISPPIGTINPGSQINVNVTFNTTGLPLGKYNANITITSNDPDESVVNVPVRLTTQPDTTSPTYSKVSRDNTEVGEPALLSAYWCDDIGLTGFNLSTNNSGRWKNTTYPMTGQCNWSNATIILNSTAHLTIGWIIYAKDTSGNWNNTGVQTILTADTKPPIVTSATANPPTIFADGAHETLLNVTATDISGIKNVTVNLSAIGRSETQELQNNNGVWQCTTNATINGTFELPVNVTDNEGNSNINTTIALEAVSIGTDLIFTYRDSLLTTPADIFEFEDNATVFVVVTDGNTTGGNKTITVNNTYSESINVTVYDNGTNGGDIASNDKNYTGYFNITSGVTNDNTDELRLNEGDTATITANLANDSLAGTKTISRATKCFIATAAYGTPLHEDINVLRDFRDEHLMTNPVGEVFVQVYYATSPPIAGVISENEWLRTIVREGLVKPLVYIVKVLD